tara:strand:- start:125 stop:391 length:267 start_codon:yes stop_codon:yes gene_type:complete
MELTHFTKYNYKEYFKSNPNQLNLKWQITHWVLEKEITLPDWHQYAFNEKGEIFYKFLLVDDPTWQFVGFNKETGKSNVYHAAYSSEW